jgi:hypothetical protein
MTLVQCLHVFCSCYNFIGGRDESVLAAVDDGRSPLPDVTTSEMFLFLVVIICTVHNTHDNLKDCSSTAEQLFVCFLC